MTEADEARVVSLLRADVEAIIGGGHEEQVVLLAARRRFYSHDRETYLERVVEDVQQYFHDTFVDTTWPACPYHPNHPLWFSDGYWRCEQIGKPVAALGSLAPGR